MQTMAEINLKRTILLSCLLLVGSLVFGHPLPSTKVDLQINGKSILGMATMPADELSSATKSKINVDNLDEAFLIKYFKKHIQIKSKTQSWKVEIKSFDSFKEDDREHGGHHGVIPFLIVHFELLPSNGNVLEPFTFNYDAITHEVLTHDVDIFQVFTNGDKSEKTKLGQITIDIKTETFKPTQIQLQKEYQKNNFLWLIIAVGIAIIVIGFIIRKRKKNKKTTGNIGYK